MRIFFALIFCIFLLACEKEKVVQDKQSKSLASTEKNDEKLELNDKNLPLPVNENTELK